MGSLRASDTAIINELRDGFARVENRLDQIYNHKERVEHLEAAGKTRRGLSPNSVSPK